MWGWTWAPIPDGPILVPVLTSHAALGELLQYSQPQFPGAYHAVLFLKRFLIHEPPTPSGSPVKYSLPFAKGDVEAQVKSVAKPALKLWSGPQAKIVLN